MRPFKKILWLQVVLVAAVCADQYNQKIILVGDKGAALGGAFAGIADDATATYYNPAGLTQLKNVKLNVSAQVMQYQMQRLQIAPGIEIPYNSFGFSPSITSFSQRLGRWAYGFSLVTPQNDIFRGDQQMEAAYRDTNTSSSCYATEGNTPCFSHLSLSYNDVSRINLLGPSLAYKWNDRLSVGATLYGIYYTQLEKTAYGGWDANYVGGNTADLSKFSESLVWRTVNQIGYGLTGSLGFLYRVDESLSLGAKLSPGDFVEVNRVEEQRIELFQNELVTANQVGAVPTYSSLYAIHENESHVELSSPNLSLGVAWTPIPRLALAGQVDYLPGSLYRYTGYKSVGDTAARSGFEILKPDTRTYDLEKNTVVNFSGGVDFHFNPTYSLAVGGFTDFSQGPNDSREAAWNKRIDYFGGALSIGMDKQYTESRFGINGSWGQASITHFQWETAPGGKPVVVYQNGNIYLPRLNFNAFIIGVFISSTLKI